MGEVMRRLCVALIYALALSTAEAAASCAPPMANEATGGVAGDDTCLLAWLVLGDAAKERGGPLFILVHGDGGGTVRQGYLETWQKLARELAKKRPDARVLFLQRPGYRSSLGASEGYANSTDDDYTARNVERVAQAVAVARKHYAPDRIVYVGHSGGAAIGALAFGRLGAIADRFLFVGCPCGDLAAWREHRNNQRGGAGRNLWPNSLSPLANLDKLAAGVPVVLVTGDRDDNTLPKFAEAWLAQAKGKGVEAQMVLAPQQTHSTSLGSPETLRAALDLAR
jgi:pimeloyl-ACP methyl ester carboxylesterase